MSLILRPPGEQVPLPDRLAALGRSRKAALVAAGAFAFLALVPLAVAAAGLLDAALHLPAAVRAVLLGAILALAGAVFVRHVRRPLREPADPLAVAHLLERRYPRLNDALASAVSFLHDGDGPLRGARQFRKVAVIRAENLADRHELGEVVPAGRAWRAWWAFAAAAAVVLGLVLPDPGRARHALVRLADPFGHHPWPAKTHLTLLAPEKLPVLLAKGDPFDVRFSVRGVIPEHAAVDVRYPGSPGVGTDTIPLAEEEHPAEVFRTVRLDPNRVSRDFEFRVTANDADTGWQSVRVAPPPKLVPLDGRPSPQLHLAFPAYTQLPPADLPDGAAVIEAVNGTRIRLRAATDRRVVVAYLRNQTENPAVPPAQAAAPLAGLGVTPFGPPGSALLADAIAADIPVQIHGDGRVLEVEFAPPLPGLYALRFADEEGLAGTRLFDLRTFPDPAPTVALERPAAGQDPLTVLPTATVTVRARAEDRVYAARRMTLEYRVGDGPVVELPLADVTPAGTVLPAIASPAAVPVHPQALLLQGGRPVPVAAFQRPDGSPPADGDVITLRAAATDWDDVTLLKDPGRSPEVTLRVLAPSSFDTLIQKELAQLRPELARARDAQKEAADKLKDLAKTLPPTGRLSAEDREALAQIDQAQRQVQNQVADPRDGARAKAEQVRDLIRANELPRSPVTERAEAVARALGRLDEEHLQNVPPQLAAAKQEADKAKPDPKAVKDPLAKAEKHQRGAAEGLDAALEQLERWAGAGELRGDVRAVKDQVNKAGQEAGKAADRTPDGKSPDQLTPAEKAELNRAAEKFDQAAAESAGLIAKASRVAGEKAQQAEALKAQAAQAQAAAEKAAADAKNHPAGSDAAKASQAKADSLQAEASAAAEAANRAAAEAESLRKAVTESGGQALPEDLRRAADATRQNRPGEAAAAKQSADARLDKMRDQLAEKREDADELRKKKAAAEQVEKLTEDQDELRKKVEKAAETKDAEARAEELKRLAKEQERLQEQAEQLARKLTRDGADPAAEELKRAAEQMEQNRGKMEQGQPPTDQQQDEAADRLQKAKQELKAEESQDQEQLLREKREELLKEFQGLYERQKAALEEADRLHKTAEKAKRWERPLLASLSDLADREQTLSEEVRRFAEKKLEPLKLAVFERMAKQAANEMEKAAKVVTNRKDDLLAEGGAFDPDAEPAAAGTVRRPMQYALRRMQQILDSLKPDDKKDQKADAGGGGGGGGGGGSPQGGAGVPPLAQLKALRDWQAEINERTAAFAKDHPDPAKITDDEKAELKNLEQAQKDIAELFEQLLPLFQQQRGADIP